MSDAETPTGSGPGPRAPGAGDLARVFGELARLGGFSALTATERPPQGPGWTSFAELCGTPALVDARIDLVAAFHRPAERRVAASVAQLGLAARVVTPPLAAAAAGIVLDVPAERLYWDLTPGSARPPCAVTASGRTADPADAEAVAAALHASVTEALLRPLADAVRARTRISERLLWGNAASAVGGAVLVLARQRPEWADGLAAVATALIAHGPMRGLGTVVRPAPGAPERRFVRRSCCLLYRAPAGDVCGDCSLRGTAGTGGSGSGSGGLQSFD